MISNMHRKSYIRQMTIMSKTLKRKQIRQKLGIDAYYMKNMTDASLKEVNVKGAVPAMALAFLMRENCLIIRHR